MRAIALHIGLIVAALTAADTAFAQSRPDRSWYPGLSRIRCAAASDLCGWKRIPGTSSWRRGYRHAPRRPRTPEPSPQ
jgi:hypothetical protein